VAEGGGVAVAHRPFGPYGAKGGPWGGGGIGTGHGATPSCGATRGHGGRLGTRSIDSTVSVRFQATAVSRAHATRRRGSHATAPSPAERAG
jgi:hypothetical protein